MERLTFPSQKLTDSIELHLRYIAPSRKRLYPSFFIIKLRVLLKKGIEACIRLSILKEQNVRSIFIWKTYKSTS